jgi:hypothetical protein
MDSHFEQARRFFLEGVAHYQAGRLAQAERSSPPRWRWCRAAVVLTNLGAVRLKLGAPRRRCACCRRRWRRSRQRGGAGPLRAPRWRNWAAARGPGTVRARAGADRAGRAVDAARHVLRELGAGEAAASFREALARGGDPELNRYYLAGVEAAPRRARRRASTCEACSTAMPQASTRTWSQAADYDAPQAAAAAGAPGAACACAGPGLRHRAVRAAVAAAWPARDGVDLSRNMLDRRARAALRRAGAGGRG